jgi:acetyl-CoA acetyltransferase
MNSKEFCEKHFQSGPIGSFDRSITNVNGGAIALGHPVGTTGTRLVITLLKELKRSQKNKGIATLCIGGGQGASFLLERE